MARRGDEPLSILIVEDNPADTDLVREHLKEAGYGDWKVDQVDRLASALAHLQATRVDCILLDLGLPDAHGLDSLTALASSSPTAPVVVLSGRSDEDTALEALRHGAQDYLLKGRADGDVLARTVRYAIERKRMDLARAEFIARAAHELRTPLAVIAGLSETLGGRFQHLDRDQVEDILDALRRQGRRAADLITKLLDLSQVEMGGVAFRRDPVVVAEAASAAITHTPPPENVRVDARLDPAIRVDTDRMRVEQIVSNLLANAYKYGGDEVLVEVTARDATCVITVSDNGPGVASETQAKLFEPFARGDRTGNVEGSGLGLAICRRLAEGLGGQLTYTGAVGSGARFELSLPR